MRILTCIALFHSVVYGFSTTFPATTNSVVIAFGWNPSRSIISSSSLSINSQTILSLSRGGATANNNKKSSSTALELSSTFNPGSKCPMTGTATVLASLWGAGGVLYILAKAIKRVVPVALEPFRAGAVPLSQFQLGAYVITCLFFAYFEGYKGFQLKFSPLVVKRSFTLVPGKNGTSWYHFFLAPIYSMGLIHATRKRKIVSWSVTIGVGAIVAAVKRLPYPWRNIIDAGVVAGLSWGSLSILVIYLKSWITGSPPKETDAALPGVIIK